MPSFGENLRALRRSRGYSQEQFAKIINSNQACVTAWERGMRLPHLSVIQGIADTFKIPLSTLLPLDETGNESDSDRELLDYIRSNKLVYKIVRKSRSLSEDNLLMILDLIDALNRTRV
jgi:transcriptional regulator with XRE-family HTH domain